MAIFYPPPFPAFPRPQAVVTQVTPAGSFTQPRVGRATAIILTAWVAAYSAPQRLQAAPVFPAAPPPQDTSFLRSPSYTSSAILSTWFAPAVVPVFAGAPPPQGQASTPFPALRDIGFENYLKSPAPYMALQRLGVAPVFPPPPDLGYLFNPAARIIPSVIAQFRAAADQPLPVRLQLVPPQIGMVPSLVLPASTSPFGAAAQIIEQVWLAPKNGVIRLVPVPVFPLPPTPVLPPRNFAFDATLAASPLYVLPRQPLPPPFLTAIVPPTPDVVVLPPAPKYFLRKRGDARRIFRIP